MDEALSEAKAVVGGAASLARLIGGISSQAVSQWERVPAERVISVERATGVSRHRLRPDIYPATNGAVTANDFIVPQPATETAA